MQGLRRACPRAGQARTRRFAQGQYGREGVAMRDETKRVFAALDGGKTMRTVAEQALVIAAEEGAALRLGHIVDALPADATGADHAALAESVKARLCEELSDVIAAARADGRIPSVEMCVAAGPVKRTLARRLIDPWHPDTVVCGTRGLSRLQYALTGSVSTYLKRNLTCPVLVVR